MGFAQYGLAHIHWYSCRRELSLIGFCLSQGQIASCSLQLLRAGPGTLQRPLQRGGKESQLLEIWSKHITIVSKIFWNVNMPADCCNMKLSSGPDVLSVAASAAGGAAALAIAALGPSATWKCQHLRRFAITRLSNQRGQNWFASSS